MSAPLDCPRIECWPALLDASLPPEQREGYERHLETCRDCQDRLDRAEESGDALRLLGRELGDPTLAPADPTLVQVLERLHEGKAPIEPPDLYFLRPADRPGLLGMLGEYEVLEVIGQGGMGVVLKAFDTALHRHVAIKVLAPALAGSATARCRFTREAKAAAAVCHDHVVAVHGVHEADGLPYLVMQYVPGESLQERLDRAGPLEVVEAVRVGLQAARGLAAAHARGLIHRDVKPANLLLEGGLARVKVTDFGLARMADDVGLTRAGMVAGTPEYMAPEQARGEAVDHRADLFSLGAVLYACCTGVPPFRAATPLAVLQRVNDQAPVPVRELNPGVPAWLEALIARLMAKAPADRFRGVAEVVALLEGFLAHLRQPATVPAPELPAAPHGRRAGTSSPGARRGGARWLRHTLVPAALVLAATLGVGSVWWLAAAGPTPSEAQTHEQSFKGGPGCPSDFRLFGPGAEEHVQFQPDGLRITLPPGSQAGGEATGVRSLFGVRGDFEITVSFEVLGESPPADPGGHTRFTLEVSLDGPEATAASFSRRTRVEGGVDFLPWVSLWNEATQKSERASKAFPTTARSGRLRLVRNGSSLSYYASEGQDGNFMLLQTYPFSDEEVKEVVLAGATEDAPASLDVRVSDLRVRMLPLPNVPGSAAPAPGRGRGRLAAAAIIGLLSVLALLGGWLLARRNRRKAPVPDTAVKPAVAPPLAFACPGCGHALKAKARLAGKKVKCPRCGHAVSVPGPVAAVSRRSPSRRWLLLALAPLALLAALVLAVLASRTGLRPGHPAGGGGRGPSFLNASLGGEAVPGVEESGFSYQEYDQGRPFRWTDGDGRLVIPIDKAKPPRALVVQLVTYRGPGVKNVSLEVRVNEHPVFHDQIHLGSWEKTFDLKGIDLGDRLVLDLVSDTFSPMGNREGNGQISDDARTLGVQVRGVKLLARAVEVRELAAADRGLPLGQDHPAGFCGGALTPDGKTLVTGGWEGSVVLWDVTANRQRLSLPGLAPQLQALAVSPDGTTFATATRDRVVRIWDAATGQCRAELRGHTGDLMALAYAPDGKTLASAAGNDSQRGELKLWDVAAGSERLALNPLKVRPRALAYAPDGKSVAVAGAAWTVEVVDTSSGSTRASIEYPSYARGVAFSPDGRLLAVSYSNAGVVRVFQVEGTREWCRVQAPHGNSAGRLQFAPDGRRLAMACTDGSALVWDVSDPQAPAVTVLAGHEAPVRFAAFLPDSRTVVTGDDGAIRLWSLGDPVPLPAPPAAAPAAAPPRSDRLGGWAVAGLLALTLAVSLGAWLCVRRRRRAGAKPAGAPAQDAKAQPGAAPAAVSFPCPACGRNLKVRAELAGKKVKCPQCGRAVQGPGAGASESIRPAR